MTKVISERKRAEEAISHIKRMETAFRESEKRFKDFAEAASDWFWEMDENLHFTFHSDRYFEITGFRPEDKIGTTRTQYVDPANLETNAEKWSAHMEDLEARRPFKNFEYAFKALDGRIICARTSGIPVFDAESNFLGYRGTGTDITDRKRAEELLQDAVESIPDGFALYDADDRLVLFNKNFLKGRPGLENILKVGMTFEGQSRLREKLGLRAKHKGTSSIPLKERIERHRNPTGPYEAQLPDGRTLQINEFKTHAGGTAIIRTDITERVEAEGAASRLVAAIEGLSENFALFGPDEKLVICNENYRRLNEALPEATRPGVSYEEHMRAVVDKGLAPKAM